MKIKKEKLFDYFVLCARVLLAWTFLSYGWGKLTGGQFGLKPEQLDLPLRQIGLFKLSWYLFDQEPFRSFIGISQIMAGILLLYNRTVIIGALLSLPILTNILIIDITYLKMPGFYWRLSYYLFLAMLILWHYRDRMTAAFKNIFNGLSTKFTYPLWASGVVWHIPEIANRFGGASIRDARRIRENTGNDCIRDSENDGLIMYFFRSLQIEL
jgi:uncharacterized membrane protein YphA (DoxX/SURF4 family)